jgi:hypothetical protein
VGALDKLDVHAVRHYVHRFEKAPDRRLRLDELEVRGRMLPFYRVVEDGVRWG